ncbi:hypothetical protein RRG08_047058 [Elysia crispata]|uniref:Uncharacterized protein n=1 Tax=Elysia crispata TaxID=231223 RepID=A0AAE1AX14_9GAST|nr:hypothetical protein RRG08_047058 [Elysia crispata]
MWSVLHGNDMKMQDIPRQAQSNLKQAPQDIINVENSSVHSDVEQLDNVDDDTQSTATILPRSSPQEPRREAKETNNKRQAPDNDILTLACKTLQSANAEDGHDIFGQNVANKLRQMTNEQQIFAEKIISDVLFEGRLRTCAGCPNWTRVASLCDSNKPDLQITIHMIAQSAMSILDPQT